MTRSALLMKPGHSVGSTRRGRVSQRTRFLAGLGQGDRRSLRGVAAAVRAVQGDPTLFAHLVHGMSHPSGLIRMRCADAVEKVTAEQPGLLLPFKGRLLALSLVAEQAEVRWHIAQLLCRLPLSPLEQRSVASVLYRYLRDRSHIVKVCAMQALAELAESNPGLRPRARATLELLTRRGSPAVQSRGRLLLERLGRLPLPAAHADAATRVRTPPSTC